MKDFFVEVDGVHVNFIWAAGAARAGALLHAANILGLEGVLVGRNLDITLAVDIEDVDDVAVRACQHLAKD